MGEGRRTAGVRGPRGARWQPEQISGQSWKKPAHPLLLGPLTSPTPRLEPVLPQASVPPPRPPGGPQGPSLSLSREALSPAHPYPSISKPRCCTSQTLPESGCPAPGPQHLSPPTSLPVSPHIPPPSPPKGSQVFKQVRSRVLSSPLQGPFLQRKPQSPLGVGCQPLCL